MIFTTRAMQEIKDRLKGLGLANSTIKTYSNILQNFFKHIGKTTNITEQEINIMRDCCIVRRLKIEY